MEKNLVRQECSLSSTWNWKYGRRYLIGQCTAPRLRLIISLAIDPRLSKSKIWNLWKKGFFFLIISFTPWPIRLIVLIVNSFLFKTLYFQNRWLGLYETENVAVYGYYPQHEIFCSFWTFSEKWRPFWKNVDFRLSEPLNGSIWN